MRQYKWLTPFFLLIAAICILGACGTLPEKPTGIEDTKNEQSIESDKADKTNDEKPLTADSEVDAKDENEHPKNNANKSTEKKKDHKDAKEIKVKEEKSTSDNKSDQKDPSSTDEKSATKSEQTDKSSTKEKAEKKTEQKSKTSAEQKSANKNNNPSEKNKKDNATKETENKSSKDANESKPASESEDSTSTIVHSIVISSNEVPLPPTELEIEEGDTVLDALIEITMKHKIHMDYRGGQGATAYVQGMGNVYEFDRGSGSGWMYSVNGIFPDRGAGVVPLMDGDRVEWKYTTNLGEDLNADLKPFRR